MLLAGLDIETTGLDPDKEARLIQIGLSVLDTESLHEDKYVRDVRPIGNIFIEAKALEVNTFTLDRIANADSTATVDAWFDQQLRKDGYKYDTMIPVGWNVVAFDAVFIRKEMPLLYKHFMFASPLHSTRAIDLTALGLLVEYKTGVPYSETKRVLKEQAATKLGYNKEHDALYDAEAALLDLKQFRDWLTEV